MCVCSSLAPFPCSLLAQITAGTLGLNSSRFSLTHILTNMFSPPHWLQKRFSLKHSLFYPGGNSNLQLPSHWATVYPSIQIQRASTIAPRCNHHSTAFSPVFQSKQTNKSFILATQTHKHTQSCSRSEPQPLDIRDSTRLSSLIANYVLFLPLWNQHDSQLLINSTVCVCVCEWLSVCVCCWCSYELVTDGWELKQPPAG